MDHKGLNLIYFKCGCFDHNRDPYHIAQQGSDASAAQIEVQALGEEKSSSFGPWTIAIRNQCKGMKPTGGANPRLRSGIHSVTTQHSRSRFNELKVVEEGNFNNDAAYSNPNLNKLIMRVLLRLVNASTRQ